jgi:hypothetical protein
MEHGNFEEDDEEDQHAHAVHAEDAIEPLGRQQVNRLPSRQHDQHGRHGADEQRHDRRDRVRLDQPLGAKIDAAPGRLASSKRSSLPRHGVIHHDGGGAHWAFLAVATAGPSSTTTRPTIM